MTAAETKCDKLCDGRWRMTREFTHAGKHYANLLNVNNPAYGHRQLDEWQARICAASSEQRHAA
jgi:hypothetical protein